MKDRILKIARDADVDGVEYIVGEILDTIIAEVEGLKRKGQLMGDNPANHRTLTLKEYGYNAALTEVQNLLKEGK